MKTVFYPMFASLEGRVCLVVGGGSVAERKVRGLLRRGASIRVAAASLTPRLKGWIEDARIHYEGEEYQENLLEKADLVFAATNDPILNRQVAEHARQRGLWCNMATNPELGSFIVPSVIERGPISIAVSTTGLSPALARLIRERLEREFGPEWVQFAEFMGKLRKLIRSKGLETRENQRLFRDLSRLPFPTWIRENKLEEAFQTVQNVCDGRVLAEELAQIWDESWKVSS